MAATKDKTPLPAYDSDSDEAPEVVTKQSAAEQALTLQRQQDEAQAQAKALTKRKRKSKPEPKKEAEEVPELPDDVLSAVAAHHEEEEQLEQQETAAQIRAKKRKQAKVAELMKKKTHTRQFGSIQVQTLDALEDAQTRELSQSAKEFLERRMAPNRPRMNVLEGHPSQFTKKQKRSQRS